MKVKNLLKLLVTGFSCCLAVAPSHAGIPVFELIPTTPTTINITANETAIVQYRVTNNKRIGKPDTLLNMIGIPGVTQVTQGAGVCQNPFTLPSGGSCLLTLRVNGSQITGPINDGPVVCPVGSAAQCYRPSAENVLNIAAQTTFIGEDTGEGVVACLNGGKNNLIITLASLGRVEDIWGVPLGVTGADSDTDGAANTSTITTALGNNNAAGMCAEYEVDSQGNTPCLPGNTCYKDWFLPAIDQLRCLFDNKNEIGGFEEDFYLSSTENDANTAWAKDFRTGTELAFPKSDNKLFRCVRSFTP